MELYLLKSAVILAILYGFYKLVLENETMHVFKRFYLLATLPAGFLIPLITFKTYVEIPVSSSPIFIENSFPMAIPEASINPWPYVLWGLYTLGVVFFSINFGKNLNRLISKIKNNPKVTLGSINHILLKAPVVPHTFLNYVFLNKQKFEAREIPDEVIQHEHVHAKQKHSIDILVVELLQIMFWFNPLFYFIKRSIKLNHEFLADRAVLNQGAETATYQNLLLAFSSIATTPALANSINYSLIKKRFTVMKKQTSTQAIWLRSLLVLPLLAILSYGFSTSEIIFEQEYLHSTENNLIQDIQVLIDKNENIFINGKQIALEDIPQEINKLNTHLTVEQKQKYLFANIGFEGEVNNQLAEKIGQLLYSSNIRRWSTSHLTNQKKIGLKPVPNNMAGKTAEEAEILYQEMIKKGKEINKTEKNKNNPWSINVSESGFIIEKQSVIQQEKATPAEIEEYNKLAKKYNNMPKDNLRINAEEVKRFSLLYHKMTLEQRKNAEPFPSVEGFPSAPPAPDAPKVAKIPSVPPVPPVPSISDPLKLAEEVREKGGEFYIDDQKIGYDEFIEKLEQIRTTKQNYCFSLERGENNIERLRITVQE